MRRTFLGRSAQSVGAVALASLVHGGLPRAQAAGAAKGMLSSLPFPQKAKRVIWLTMAGGPSHLETFDPKPRLAEMDGRPMPESMTRGQQLTQLQGSSSSASLPSSNSGGSAKVVPKSARISRTSAQWPTISASSAQ
ncbi:MAG: DUF1501 domain-containing protein [Planctomycetota bacterium]